MCSADVLCPKHCGPSLRQAAAWFPQNTATALHSDPWADLRVRFRLRLPVKSGRGGLTGGPLMSGRRRAGCVLGVAYILVGVASLCALRTSSQDPLMLRGHPSAPSSVSGSTKVRKVNIFISVFSKLLPLDFPALAVWFFGAVRSGPGPDAFKAGTRLTFPSRMRSWSRGAAALRAVRPEHLGCAQGFVASCSLRLLLLLRLAGMICWLAQELRGLPRGTVCAATSQPLRFKAGAR